VRQKNMHIGLSFFELLKIK